MNNLKAFVFDLDGTLVDSRLDFDLMRKDLGFPENVPILEHLSQIKDPDKIKKSEEIIFDHELRGAKNCTLYPGVRELIKLLKSHHIHLGILTRNNREVAKMSLDKFSLEFDIVICRDDCQHKPNPEGLFKMAQEWSITPREMIFIGDYNFDIETAKNANSFSGLYLNNRNKHLMGQVDITIDCYTTFNPKDLIEVSV